MTLDKLKCNYCVWSLNFFQCLKIISRLTELRFAEISYKESFTPQWWPNLCRFIIFEWAIVQLTHPEVQFDVINSLKLSMLMTLTTSQRIQTFQSFSIIEISWQESQYTFREHTIITTAKLDMVYINTVVRVELIVKKQWERKCYQTASRISKTTPSCVCRYIRQLYLKKDWKWLVSMQKCIMLIA